MRGPVQRQGAGFLTTPRAAEGSPTAAAWRQLVPPYWPAVENSNLAGRAREAAWCQSVRRATACGTLGCFALQRAADPSAGPASGGRHNRKVGPAGGVQPGAPAPPTPRTGPRAAAITSRVRNQAPGPQLGACMGARASGAFFGAFRGAWGEFRGAAVS